MAHFVNYGHGQLKFEREASEMHFVSQALLIRTLKQPRAELPVNLDCAADHLAADGMIVSIARS